MKIKFREVRFNQLLEEAKSSGLSIPKLIDNILEEHYTHRGSHIGVIEVEREIRGRVLNNPEGSFSPDKN